MELTRVYELDLNRSLSTHLINLIDLRPCLIRTSYLLITNAIRKTSHDLVKCTFTASIMEGMRGGSYAYCLYLMYSLINKAFPKLIEVGRTT